MEKSYLSLQEAIHTYLRAERQLGYLLVVLAGISALGLWYTWRYHGDQPLFGGMRWAMATVVVGGIAFGTYLHYSTLAREAQLGSLPAHQAIATEVSRMAGVLHSFVILKAVWTGLAVLSLAAIWLVQAPYWRGVLLGLLLLWVLFFAIDLFAHQRAEVYTQQLQAL